MASTRGQSMCADVAVLGGGIIGAGIARELGASGVDVLVIEATGPAAGSSGRCDGNVLVQTKHDKLGVQLTLRSIEGYRRWAEELAHPIRFEQRGSLVFNTSDDQAVHAQRRVETLRAAGVRADFIDAEEVRRREPELTGELIGAIDCYDDSSVYPPAVVAALLKDLRTRGGRVLSGVRAQRLLTGDHGRVTGVQTDQGMISAPVVINALGVWAPAFDCGARAELPIQPRQGVLVVTEEAPDILRRTVTEGVYMANRVSAGQGSEAAVAFVAERTYRGNLLIGSSRRFCGYDVAVDNDIVRAIVARAVHFMPALAGIRAIRSFAGLRPWTPDNRPLIGAVNDIPGYVLATGHEGEGVGLSPVTAELVTSVVLDQASPPGSTRLLAEARAAFDPERLLNSETLNTDAADPAGATDRQQYQEAVS